MRQLPKKTSIGYGFSFALDSIPSNRERFLYWSKSLRKDSLNFCP